MKGTTVLALAVGVALAGASGVAMSQASLPPPPPIDLEIVTPRYNPNKDPARPRQFAAGWPIVFKLTANQSLGIALNISPPDFPLENTTGYVVVVRRGRLPRPAAAIRAGRALPEQRRRLRRVHA